MDPSDFQQPSSSYILSYGPYTSGPAPQYVTMSNVTGTPPGTDAYLVLYYAQHSADEEPQLFTSLSRNRGAMSGMVPPNPPHTTPVNNVSYNAGDMFRMVPPNPPDTSPADDTGFDSDTEYTYSAEVLAAIEILQLHLTLQDLSEVGDPESMNEDYPDEDRILQGQFTFESIHAPPPIPSSSQEFHHEPAELVAQQNQNQREAQQEEEPDDSQNAGDNGIGLIEFERLLGVMSLADASEELSGTFLNFLDSDSETTP